MGRNFPSFRTLIDELERDLRRVKKLLRDEKTAEALDELLSYLVEEAGAISVAKNPLMVSLLLLIARFLTHDRGHNSGSRDR